MSLLYTLLGALLAALLGVASIMEISEDPLLVETGVALPVDIKQAFQYLAEMNNFPKVTDILSGVNFQKWCTCTE